MRFAINFLDRVKRREPDPEQIKVDAQVRELVELLREAAGGGVAEGFAAALKKLADNGPQIEKGVVAWIQLIEVLVQGAEQRYPTGRGKRKKNQVRAALHAVYDDPQLTLPDIPSTLTPLVMDVVLDWMIDALVDSVDSYGLWNDSRPEDWTFACWLRAMAALMLDMLQPAIKLLNWLYAKLRYYEPLTPEVAAAVKKVKAEGLVRDKSVLFRSAGELAIFVGQHGPQMTAAVRAFFEVVAMAERLVSATGEEKKAYATAIVKGTLKELGFPVDGGLIGAVLNVFISAGIESALALFEKRAPETFRSRTALRGPTRRRLQTRRLRAA